MAPKDSHLISELRREDRDRFLTVLMSPATARDNLIALYLFNAEMARIPEGVTEPILGRMKVQWWRDVFTAIDAGKGAPSGHPGALALQGLVQSHPTVRPWLDDMLDARDAQLENMGFAHMAALEAHVEKTAVRLAWASLRLLGVADEISRTAARDAAMGYALAGLLHAVPFHLRRGLNTMPQDLMAQDGVTTDGLMNGKDRDAFRRVAAGIAAHAKAHVASARMARRDVDKRGLAVFQWATMASGVLRMLARTDTDVFHPRMLAYRTPVWPLLWGSWLGRF
jgi:phytoene synthase